MITSFGSEKIIKILNIVLKDFSTIAMDQHGVCAVKMLIEKYVPKGSFEKKLIVENIISNFDFLVQDPYANYSIKHCLEVHNNYNLRNSNTKMFIKLSSR